MTVFIMKVFWSCLIAVSIVLQHASNTIAISTEAATETMLSTTNVTSIEDGAENADVMNSNVLPTAAKLVRYRRQPPITIVKHVVRSSKRSRPRRRSKRPKIRYGPPPHPPAPPQPPSYVYEDQSSYYKSHYTMPPASDTIASFGLDDFSSLNLNAADFELPPSSYEAQSMELDFYGKTEERIPYQSIPSVQPPSNEYNRPEFEPTFSYKPLPRKPHQKYGVPKHQEYSNDFNSDINSEFDFSLYNSYQTHSSPNKDDDSSQFQHVPDVPYIPSSHTFQPSRPIDYNPPDYNQYPSYEQSQTHLQPEPHPHPQPGLELHPTQTSAGIEITYSPSYEVNSLPPTYPTNEDPKPYETTDTQIQPGNFAEPPEPIPYQPTSQSNPMQETQSHSGYVADTGSIDYVQLSHELPLNPHHKQPAYDFPKSSYEVPIYDPIPFEASTTDEQEYYPPHNIYKPPMGSAKQENNFDISSASGPASVDGTPQDTHTSESGASTSATSKQHRYKTKKRQRRPMIGTTKHVLDVPELKAAFEATRPNKYISHPTTTSTTRTSNSDAEVNASSFVEDKQQITSIKPINYRGKEKYFNGEWNPMRIRGIQTIARDSALTANSQSSTTIKIKSNKTSSSSSRQRPMNLNSAKRQTTSRSVLDEPNVSIEKSHSQSYYDGTLAPPILTMSNIYNNSRLNKFRTPTRSSASKSAHEIYKESSTIPVKRTTKSVFDTTHFKSPHNEWGGAARVHLPSNQARLNLPKNHKLY